MHEQKLVLAVENQRVANASTKHACIVGFSAARQADALEGGGGGGAGRPKNQAQPNVLTPFCSECCKFGMEFDCFHHC